jgi:hypothetical protein
MALCDTVTSWKVATAQLQPSRERPDSACPHRRSASDATCHNSQAVAACPCPTLSCRLVRFTPRTHQRKRASSRALCASSRLENAASTRKPLGSLGNAGLLNRSPTKCGRIVEAIDEESQVGVLLHCPKRNRFRTSSQLPLAMLRLPEPTSLTIRLAFSDQAALINSSPGPTPDPSIIPQAQPQNFHQTASSIISQAQPQNFHQTSASR